MNRLFRVTFRSLLGAGLIFGAFFTSSFAQEKPKAAKSKIKVTVPDKNAELKIDGKATTTTGLERGFDTPELEAGKKYKYDFLITWRPNNYTVITRERTVEFLAGDDVVVDLTKESPDKTDRAEIRYVPTPDDIVAEMVKIAEIKKDDVIFEPGCGDGRIVVAAVKAGAKKGVGIDLDKKRVAESKDTVKAAGLVDKVEIREGDALDQPDYGDATVVMLYMGDEFNSLIRPILLRDLKVGARIVSHRFTFEKKDWKPDETKMVTGIDGDEYEVHIWKVTEEAKKKYAGPEKKK
jgi:uncharacterized protein (TIGR03000 family)